MLLKKILLTTLFLSFPINSYSLTIQESGHILNKIGFSPNTKEAQKFLDLSFEKSIDRIINESNIETETEYPKTNKDYLKIKLKDLSQQEKKIYQAKFRNEAFLLKEWWYQEMIKTDSPLTERMTMFWHNHFTSSIKKIRIPDLMLEQNKLFRKNSLGNFKELLKEIVKDPAMLMYLDTQSNKKNAPNENFARELLELFTMGEGHYTEKDIKESAKAFTGLRFNREKGEVVFNKKQF
ncbi:MAG: DUF1800 family protein, partial [Candidatus Sericytochromatia bacterium]